MVSTFHFICVNVQMLLLFTIWKIADKMKKSSAI